MATYETYKGLVDNRELLDFSQNFQVERPAYLGSTLFPDRKTQYMEAEYYRLIRNGNLPLVAEVHALDTEAKIGSRLPLDRIQHEELLIKEKINQTESLRKVINSINMDDTRQYVFDDIARTAEKIVTRVEVAKMEALSDGKMTIEENNLSMVIDYGIPEENRIETSWDEDADILSDLRDWRQICLDNGVIPDRAFTTERVVTKMMKNTQLQKALFGVYGEGVLPTLNDINTRLGEQVGIRVETVEQRYGELLLDDTGTAYVQQKRFFPENTFVMVSTNNGAIGTGLWGVTPEEEAQGEGFTSRREQQYVTITQWETPDPVAVWTKASGLFVPVLPNPYGHIIASIEGDDDSGNKG